MIRKWGFEMKLTSKRKKILDLVLASQKPVTAKEIFNQVSNQTDLSTVYRALEFLTLNGFLKTVAFFNNTRFYFHPQESHRHFLYCESCNQLNEFHRCVADKMAANIQEEYGFTIKDHFFYFSGLCKNCSQK